MVIFDPIADMFSLIRNSYLAHNKVVEVSYSRIKQEIASMLVKEGFLNQIKTEGKDFAEKKIVMELKYLGREPALIGIKRISKPGCRIYARADKIPVIRTGRGFSIISTAKGLMTDREARKKNLGGEVIGQAW